jgi:hypothetical protein
LKGGININNNAAIVEQLMLNKFTNREFRSSNAGHRAHNRPVPLFKSLKPATKSDGTLIRDSLFQKFIMLERESILVLGHL